MRSIFRIKSAVCNKTWGSFLWQCDVLYSPGEMARLTDLFRNWMLNHALLVAPSKEAYVCRNPLYCKVRVPGGRVMRMRISYEDSSLSIMF